MKRLLLSGLLLVGALFPLSANAVLIVDNWTLTSDSLTFDLHGTVDVVGTNDTDSFFIGPRDSLSVDWINGSLTQAIITQNGGSYAADTYSAAYNSGTYGEYVYSNNSSNIFVGQVVDLSFSISGLNVFNTAAISIDDIIVSAGYNVVGTGLPDGQIVTGSGSTSTSVPEPSTIALFGFALLGLGFANRKKNV